MENQSSQVASGDVSSEENMITPEEFEKLEKEEGKKEEKEGKTSVKESKKNISELDQFTIDIEKLNGRIDMMEDLRKTMDEGISRLSEEIGELRSSLLQKERGFNKIETGFSEMKELLNDIRPEKITENFAKKEEEILKLSTKVELLEAKNNELKTVFSGIEDVIKKIKNLDYLLDVSDRIKKQMLEIENNKKFTDRVAGKVEEIFSELQKEASEFHDSKSKIEFNEAAVQDMLRDLGKLELKIQNEIPKKKDVENNMKGIEDKVSSIESESQSGLNQLRDIMDSFLAKLEKIGVGNLFKEGSGAMGNLVSRDEFERLGNELTAQVGELKTKIGEVPASFAQAPPQQASHDTTQPQMVPHEENGPKPKYYEGPYSRLFSRKTEDFLGKEAPPRYDFLSSENEEKPMEEPPVPPPKKDEEEPMIKEPEPVEIPSPEPPFEEEIEPLNFLDEEETDEKEVIEKEEEEDVEEMLESLQEPAEQTKKELPLPVIKSELEEPVEREGPEPERKPEIKQEPPEGEAEVEPVEKPSEPVEEDDRADKLFSGHARSGQMNELRNEIELTRKKLKEILNKKY